MAKENTKKTFIGYDLGDGETITDLVTLVAEKATSKTNFNDMTMPDGNTPGRAMPTIFAYNAKNEVLFSKSVSADPEEVHDININFKRRPTDLIKTTSNISDGELVEILKKSSDWPNTSQWEAANDEDLINYKDKVVAFTNAIFENENFKNRVKSAANDSDEIVFCVGHPTNWSKLDVAIYELIMRNTVLGSGKYAGKKTGMVMEAESRAAFLYSKDVQSQKKLPYGTSVLLIDIGSSTIDVTAMSATSHDNQYNSGNNYLGARSIDFMIRDWYLDKLKENPASWNLYEESLKLNPSVSNALTLSCREAKEEIYSSTADSTIVRFGLFPSIKLYRKELDEMIEKTPISKALEEIITLPNREIDSMGNKNWKQLFREFLCEKKAEMQKLGIKISQIILTGSASKMPFVSEIILSVFGEVSKDSLIYDMDPSRTISKGLALVGPSNEKSKAFSEELNKLIDEKLNTIIENNIPYLAENTGQVVYKIVVPVIKNRIQEWKDGKIKTLNDMNEQIKADFSPESFGKLLLNNKEYNKTIEKWLKDKIGKDIAVELNDLCRKYGVKDMSIDDLNIMTVPSVTIDGPKIDASSFMNTVSNVISIIAGLILGIATPVILGVIIGLISWISVEIASILFALLNSHPELILIIGAVVGIVGKKSTKKGLKNFKKEFEQKVMGFNLPNPARKLLTEKSVNKALDKANISDKIVKAFEEDQTKQEIVKKVSANLKEQIEKRAENIKYAIESK